MYLVLLSLGCAVDIILDEAPVQRTPPELGDSDTQGDLSTPPTHTYIRGESVGDLAGWSVAAAGDVNGDYQEDWLVGAYGWNDYRGAAYLVYGSITADINLDTAAERFNRNSERSSVALVAGIGDTNADGYADIAITNAGSEYSYILFGPAHSQTLTNDDIRLRGAICTSVAAAGDVNQDGYADILCGAPYENSAGEAYLLYGPILFDRPWSSADLIVEAESLGDGLGQAVVAAGDINADGSGDIAIGAPFHNDDTYSFTGATYIIFGGTEGDLAANAADVKLTAEAIADYGGWSVAGVPDSNGDGYDDLLIGAFGADTAYLVLGPVSGDTSLSFADAIFVGEQAGSHTGRAVAASDLDADGVPELVISAPQLSSGSTVYIVEGKQEGVVDLAGIDTQVVIDAYYGGQSMAAQSSQLLIGTGSNTAVLLGF